MRELCHIGMEIPVGAPEKQHQVLPVVAQVVQLGGLMDKGVEFVVHPGSSWNGVPGRRLGPQGPCFEAQEDGVVIGTTLGADEGIGATGRTALGGGTHFRRHSRHSTWGHNRQGWHPGRSYNGGSTRCHGRHGGRRLRRRHGWHNTRCHGRHNNGGNGGHTTRRQGRQNNGGNGRHDT
jgi:hypothetical protein